MAINIGHIANTLRPTIDSMIAASPDKTIISAKVEADYLMDNIGLQVVRVHRIATRRDMDDFGPTTAGLSRLLVKRMLTHLGHDLKNTAPRRVALARHRMNVRAKEARGLKRKKVSRMRRSRI